MSDTKYESRQLLSRSYAFEEQARAALNEAWELGVDPRRIESLVLAMGELAGSRQKVQDRLEQLDGI